MGTVLYGSEVAKVEVTYTEPGIKGDTASTNSLKPATVHSSLRTYLLPVVLIMLHSLLQ